MARQKKSAVARSNAMKAKRNKLAAEKKVTDVSKEKNETSFTRLQEFKKNVNIQNHSVNNVNNFDNSESNENKPQSAIVTETCNIIVSLDVLQNILQNTCCFSCKCNSLDLSLGQNNGLVHELIVTCNECDFKVSRHSSKRLTSCKKSPFVTNRAAVQAITALGKGHAGLELFSSFMNVSGMDSRTFSKHLKHVVSATKQTANEHLKEARKKVRLAHINANPDLASESVIDIAVSYDASWHKRGYKSNYGAGCVVDIMTGYIIDYDILSKTCQQCAVSEQCLGKDTAEFNVWFDGHKALCDADHSGSSGGMEVAIAERIWKRSVNNGFRYTTLLGDGDSKTFTVLEESNVYGSEVKLKKEECINHVGKRMGTALRNLVETEKKRGRTLGGKKHGSLTTKTINKLTKYYRNAIIRNKNDVKAMKTDIYAILYHCGSTDTKPNHKKCPYKVDSWCFYNRALCAGKKPEKHKLKIKTPLRADVICKMMPIFQRLAADSLLQRCTKSGTQNSNESLHSLIWSRCSKASNTSKQRVEAAVSQAILDYNCGRASYMQKLQANTGLTSSPWASSQACQSDARRYRKSEAKASSSFKLYRKKVHLAKLKLSKEQKDKNAYKSGAY